MEFQWYKEFLTSGGFGEIYIYRKKGSGECLAIKNMKAGDDEKKASLWAKECEMMRTLSHPNIVQTFDVPEDIVQSVASSSTLLAMEYCQDGDLRKVLGKPENMFGLSEREIRAIIRDVASAIEYIHSKSIVHRDIKPENVLLSRSTDSPSTIVYKLCDLGLAKDQSEVCQTRLGTAFYVAPEVNFRSPLSAAYDCKADYWSFGTLVFECITGRRPFFHSNKPTQWRETDFKIVKQKRSVDIFAYYTDESSSHQFSENLPANVRLKNDMLRAYLEQWLRLMLHWDADKRGGRRDKTTGRLHCFKLLEQIISMKFVRFFDIAANETSVYPVHSSSGAMCPVMTMRDVIKTMEKEKHMSLPLDSVDILTTNGHVVDANDSVVNYALSDSEAESVLYLYDRTRPWSSCSLSPFPGLLQHLFNGTNTAKQKEHQRSICTCLVYYMHEHIQSFQRLTRAAQFSHITLLKTKEVVDKSYADTEVKYKCFETKINFELECLKTDIDEAKHHESLWDEKLCTDGQAWKLPVECSRLCKWMSDLRIKCQSLQAKYTQLYSIPNDVNKFFSTLLELQASAEKLHEKLTPSEKDKPELKPEVELSYEAMKTHLDTFVAADIKLLQRLNLHFREVQQCGEEMKKLGADFTVMQQKFCEVETELKTLQQMRQKDIWQLLNHWSQKVKQNFHPVNSIEDDISAEPLSALVTELLQTRAELNNVVVEVEKYMTSPVPLDWSFLDVANDAS